MMLIFTSVIRMLGSLKLGILTQGQHEVKKIHDSAYRLKQVAQVIGYLVQRIP